MRARTKGLLEQFRLTKDQRDEWDQWGGCGLLQKSEIVQK